MTRLARHDEIVEILATQYFTMLTGLPEKAWKKLPVNDHTGSYLDQWNRGKGWYRQRATAALDALLTAVVELGVGFPHSTEDAAGLHRQLILQLEEKQ